MPPASGAALKLFRLPGSLSAFCDRRGFTKAETQLESILGSCLLERLPVIVPKDEDWEIEYDRQQRALHAKYCRTLPPEFDESDASRAEAIAENWQPAPCITEADSSNDCHSLRRKLDRRLFFMVKVKGRDGAWGLPEAGYESHETIRQTAERALEIAVGRDGSQIHFIGHAPCAHYKSDRDLCFINKAQLIDGGLRLAETSKYEDFAWLCREEILERVDGNISALFSKLLPSDL